MTTEELVSKAVGGVSLDQRLECVQGILDLEWRKMKGHECPLRLSTIITELMNALKVSEKTLNELAVHAQQLNATLGAQNKHREIVFERAISVAFGHGRYDNFEYSEGKPLDAAALREILKQAAEELEKETEKCESFG